MAITYERYCKLVSKETLEFTNSVLSYLRIYNYLDISSICQQFRETDALSRNYVIFLHVLSKTKKYKNFLDLQSYNEKNMTFPKADENINYSVLFTKFSSLFDVGESDEEYTKLTPARLALERSIEFYNSCIYPKDWSNILFDGKTSLELFISNLNKFVLEEGKYQPDYRKENEEFDKLSDKVKSYLLQASRIMQDLVENYSSNNTYIRDVMNDSALLSLLLAASYYEDNEKNKYGKTKKEIIIELLSCLGINVKPNCADTFMSYNIDNNRFDEDIHIIFTYFRKYYNDGILKGVPKKYIAVQGIIDNLLSDSLNDSAILERIISQDISDISFCEDVESWWTDGEDFSLSTDGYDDENPDLSDSVIEQFSPHCYFKEIFRSSIILIDRLRKNHFNLLPHNDIPDLSVLLRLLKDGETNEYFIKNGLDYETVCKLLNLELYYNVEAWFDYAKHRKDFKKYFDEFGTSQDYPFRDYLRVFFKDNHALDYVIDRINKACGFPKIDRRKLEVEVINNQDYLDTLSISEKMRLLDEQGGESLDFSNYIGLISCVDSFLKHPSAILNEIENKKYECNREKKMAEIITSIADTCNVCSFRYGDSKRTEAFKINRALSLRAKALRSPNRSSDKMMIDRHELDCLDKKTNKLIRDFSEKLTEHNKLYSYICKFIEKASKYYEDAQREREKLILKKKHISSEDREDFKTKLSLIETIIRRIKSAIVLAKKYLSSVCNEIASYQTDIESLQLINQVLIPIVKSKETSLASSNSIMGLINGLIVRKKSYIRTNYRLIKRSSSKEDFDKIQQALLNQNGVNEDEPIEIPDEYSRFAMKPKRALAQLIPQTEPEDDGTPYLRLSFASKKKNQF